MAGNIIADNNGDILVEFDYNNIIVVDPNKTIDSGGKIKERLVDHEKLVMYANLEAELLPRTKLAVGGAPNDRIKTVSVAKINFLKPNKETYLTTGYYDQLTGKGSTNGKGQNQMEEITAIPKDGTKPYVYQQPADLNNIVDNGLLGITQITIQTNSSFIPSVRIELEDVQGKALFELGNNSPYSAFFQLPYPQFYLTLKGYYGQAIRYQLNLEKFNARFNSFSGNYQVSLEFRGYKFNILNEISMGHLLALPHMYSQNYNVSETPVGPQQSNKTAETQGKSQVGQVKNNLSNTDALTVDVTSNRGYQKIVEVYSEYKAKGLIAPDFPELTLMQLTNKLQNFEKIIQASFNQAEVEPLTNIRTYKEYLQEYFNTIRGNSTSWFNKYLDPRPIFLTTNERVYTFNKIDPANQDAAIAELKKYIEVYNKYLADNPTLGIAGPAKIPNPIKLETIVYDKVTYDQVNWEETTTQQTGIPRTAIGFNDLKNETINKYITIPSLVKDANGNISVVRPTFFIFEGDGRFDKTVASIDSQASKKLQQYQALISAELLKKLEDKTKGLGFKPTVRNMMAVILASAEGFIRLMDDVHTNAWSVKDDPIRKRAILNNTSSAPSPDTVDNLQIDPFAASNNSNYDYSQIPVYPWPTFFVESPNDKSRFELKYVGDPSVAELTQAFITKSWPEVEFVEEYLKGLTKKFNVPQSPDTLENDKYTNIININAIEFPSFGLPYLNKEELKFFYEIWERQFVTSHYSGLIRANENQINDLITLNTETEVNNIVDSVTGNAPYLSFKLKNYDLTAANYVQNLENFSNGGTGKSYQDFIRDFYVTPYLKAYVDNPTSILSTLDLGQIPQTNTTSPALRQLLSVATNDKLIVDTIPFTDPTWCLNNMSEGLTTQNNEVYNTKKTLTVFEPRKIIANFTDVYDFKINRPVTNFSYLNINDPYKIALDNQNNQIKTLLPNREPKDFVVTEGLVNSNLNLVDVVFGVGTLSLPLAKTTSMLNTPYFVNAIQIGVENIRKKTKYPFTQAAYLFLNSLPLATLREKYKTSADNTTTDLDYIASCFNKFGAIHKIPYPWILKMGSIWYRYKLYKETSVDILTDVWKNFDYKVNYSPFLESETQTYKLEYYNYNGQTVVKEPANITLQTETTNTLEIQVGFYPKLINDFNVFYNGFELYQTYTDAEIQESISVIGMKICNFKKSNINAVNQSLKSLTFKTWSVLLPDYTNDDITCNPNTKNGGLYYIVPSFGSKVNQIKNENITNGVTLIDLTNNSAMYNGSVRTLWSTPNYGYFDNNQITMPKPNQYINYIEPKQKTQYPFKLLTGDYYSSIEEIFSVFEKSTLDKFEQEFLNFCKPITDADITQPDAQYNTSLVNLNANFRNFQSLMRTAMAVPLQTNNQNNSQQFQSAIESQNSIFQNQMKAFLQYDVIFRNGNPSKYRRRIFDSYLSYLSAPIITDPINFEPYVIGSLPTKTGNVLLSQSKLQNPKAWLALETEVGFSTIKNVEYSSTGSYITDFFVDNNIKFDAANVTILAPLIKMYASRKLETPALTAAQFKNQLNLYLQKEFNLQNNLLGLVLTGVRNKLPIQQQAVQRLVPSAINGEQSKVELWDLFKALNDKWIAGDDFKSKTLFEDILFLDRASRNIGDVILIDIFDIQGMFSQDSLNQAMSVYSFIAGILFKNNFVVMNLPGYVNFYNIQNVDGAELPVAEGSLDFANSMWGTYLDVDYRKSSPKMVCFYAPRPSSYLDLPKGNFRFRDDSFEMRRSSENPLIEDQTNKKDWAVSNKCVGFNVDIGVRNQNIFYSFSVSQDNGVATSESINTNINMINNATGKNVATQNNSLYNLYKNRSYKATVTCLGNALIQPSMYFNLRHVPMFDGPYMILDVQHQIQPGNFQTSFTGIRQGYFDLPLIDKFLQSINQNLLTKLEEVLKIKKDVPTVTGLADTTKATQVVQKSEVTVGASNSCASNVDINTYKNYEVVKATTTNISEEAFTEQLKKLIPGNQALQAIIYSITYVRSYVKNSTTKGNGDFKSFNNNFGGISLYFDWGALSKYFLKTYTCINVKGSGVPNGTSEPWVGFESLKEYIFFMRDRLEKNVERILDPAQTPGGLPQYYVCNWPKENFSATYYETNKNQFETIRNTITDALKSCLVNGIITKEEEKNLSKIIKEAVKKLSEKGVKPTPIPVTALPNQPCPPSTITSFSPLVASEGTILQINGTDLDKVKKVTIIDAVTGAVVKYKDITFLNSETIRLSIPKVGDGKTIKEGKITVTSDYGEFISTTIFKYDPAINAASASSPGGYTGNNQSSNIVSNPNAVNTNPQNTGPVTLISKYETKTGGEITNKLTVNVNPDAGAWIIEKVVKMTISVFSRETINNNTTKVLTTTVDTTVSDYVVNNIFTITSDDVKKLLITNPIYPFNSSPIKVGQIVTIQFGVTANAVDKVKYPKPTNQSFNFNFTSQKVDSPITNISELTPPGSLIEVYESNNVNLPDYSGPDFYNIKKPAGGYITFKFVCNGLLSKKEPEVFLIPELNKETIKITNNANTKYTNVIEVNNIGKFKLSVGYTADGYRFLNTTTNKLDLINATATSEPFTL